MTQGKLCVPWEPPAGGSGAAVADVIPPSEDPAEIQIGPVARPLTHCKHVKPNESVCIRAGAGGRYKVGPSPSPAVALAVNGAGEVVSGSGVLVSEGGETGLAGYADMDCATATMLPRRITATQKLAGVSPG